MCPKLGTAILKLGWGMGVNSMAKRKGIHLQLHYEKWQNSKNRLMPYFKQDNNFHIAMILSRNLLDMGKI